jgi:ParB family chromosome partitioning protein
VSRRRLTPPPNIWCFSISSTTGSHRRRDSRVKGEHGTGMRMRHSALLADALDLNMTEWFTPTADDYFAKISKAQIIDALREIKGSVPPAWSGMKKSELAAVAERETAGKRWLPEPLRIATDA